MAGYSALETGGRCARVAADRIVFAASLSDGDGGDDVGDDAGDLGASEHRRAPADLFLPRGGRRPAWARAMLTRWRAAGMAGCALALLAAAWSAGGITPAKLVGAAMVATALNRGDKWEPVDFGPLPFSIQVIHIPELPAEMTRLEELQTQYDRYVFGGRGLLVPFPGVAPGLWPQAGRYTQYKQTCAQINKTEPWWKAVTDEDPSSWIADGRAHHLGCMGSHLMVWWNARAQNVQTVLVAEVDGGPWRFSSSSQGCSGDLAGVAKAAVEQAPPGWHIIHLDVGAAGTKPGSVSRVLKMPGLSTGYDLRPWVGGGVAGTALLLVSRRWLDEFPEIIMKYRSTMVDAWFGWLCGDGVLECYSVAAQTPQSACPDLNAGL